MLQKILLFASPIVSAATVATIITVKTWKKRRPPNINITWDDDDDDYTIVVAKGLTGGTLNNSN